MKQKKKQKQRGTTQLLRNCDWRSERVPTEEQAVMNEEATIFYSTTMYFFLQLSPGEWVISHYLSRRGKYILRISSNPQLPGGWKVSPQYTSEQNKHKHKSMN